MKKSSEKNLKYLLIVVISGIFCFSSCEELIEGCPDINSVNFGFSADRACDSCCLYPEVTLQLSYRYDSTTFSTNQGYIDNSGDTFKINSFQFVVSDVAFYSSELGQKFNTRDSITIRCDSDTIQTSNSYFSFNNRSTTGTMDNLRTFTAIDSIFFNIGLSPCVQGIDLADLDPNFTTYDNISSTQDSVGIWHFQDWEYVAAGDTTAIIIDELIPISISSSYILELGENISLPVEVKIDELFSDVSFSTDSPDEIKAKIALKIREVFYYSE